MIEKSKKQKCSISEEDASTVLQRYAATTILALLQEVEQSAGSKFLNWKELVKKTTTGITNAREYQMLWRHLAYREALHEKLEDVAEPLGDDSDLECELETSPPVSNEASADAAACVKVLIASGLPSNSSLPNSSTIEAPLTINIPIGLSCRADTESSQPSCSMRGMNITVPVTVQKIDSSDAKAPVTGKKRRQWSIEEDQELLAAVEKFGPGNWANMVRGEFNGDRTANQLAQRYKTILKQRGIANTGEKEKPIIPQLSEAQLATRSALFRALDGPKPNLAPCTSNSAVKSIPSTSNQMQKQSLQGSVATKSTPVETSNLVSKSQITVKKHKSVPSIAAPATAKTSDQNQNLSQQGSTASKYFAKEPAGFTKSQLAVKKPSAKFTAAPPTVAAETSDQAQDLSQQGFIATKSFAKEPPGLTKSQIAVKKPPAKSTAALPTAAAETPDQAKKLSRQGSIATKSCQQEPSSFSKSQTASKRPNSFPTPSSILDATAVAAGARIGSPEAAASLLKAAKGNNAIRFTTSGSSTNKKPRIPALASPQHEARSGVSNESVSTSPRVTADLHSGSVKPSPPLVKNSSSASALSLNSPSQNNGDATSQAAECHPKQDLETAKETKDSNSVPSSAPKEQVQQNGKCSSTNEPCREPEVKNQVGISESSNAKTIPDNNQADFIVCTAEKKQNAIDEGSTKSTDEPNCES